METGSKKVCHGHGDQESDSSNNATIDLLPPEMLQSIYKFLPFKDLLACREVNKKWKIVATDPVRKRCAPLDFSRRDIPKSQRSTAIRNFTQWIRATNEHEDVGDEFPVTEFHLNLNSDYNWIEMDGSTLISQFLEAVRPFVKHIIFDLNGKFLQTPVNCFAIPQDTTFPKLTEITLEVFEHKNKDREIFSFIRNVIEKSPNIKELHPHFHNTGRSGAVHRCIVETGIEQKANFVTSLIINAPKKDLDFVYLNNVGFKLKHFSLNLVHHDVNAKLLKEFLTSQSDTLTSWTLCFGNSCNFRDLPCLPHLKDLSISLFTEKETEQFPTLLYKAQLPALRKLNLTNAQFAPKYFMASHLAPSESLRELIFSEGDIENPGEVVRQAARLFPNLKKLKVFHRSAGPYMNGIYEVLQGIEELSIVTDVYASVDNIITGLPERLLRKIGDRVPPSYNLSKALVMLEQGTTKTLACLENLKILVIERRDLDSWNVVGKARADFTELSGVVLKQMKSLQHIDFGIREYGPNVRVALKEDLEAHGIKLFYRKPRYIRARTDFVVSSLTESDDSDSHISDSDSYSDYYVFVPLAGNMHNY